MIKVLIADDHAVVRQGLKQILEETSEMHVAGEAMNGEEVLEQVREQPWDVLVLDMSMPGRGGYDVLKDLKQIQPKLPVLILSIHSEEQYAVRLLQAGASGYLTKESAPEELVQAIHKVVNGGRYISPMLAEKLAFQLGHESEKPAHESLSDREFQVLRLIAGGKTATQIAEDLALSVKTVSTYRTRILQKMRLKTNAELIRYAIENHLVE